jgi:hypothetical protein
VPAEMDYISLKLYAISIFDKLIQFIQGVTTEWSPASSKPNTVDGRL